MRRLYTKDQKAFFRETIPGRRNCEVVDMFKQRFGEPITEKQLQSYKKNHKLNNGLPAQRKKRQGIFTPEQEAFVRENAPGKLNAKLADLVNEKFGLSITKKQIKGWKRNHNVTSGLKGSEGMAPPNKGTKGVYNVGGNRTSFKKGQKPLNHRPVGSERINTDGYTEVKVSEPNKWKTKHVVIWEMIHGQIPKGHVVIFGDGDKRNLDISNLIMVTRQQLAVLNKNRLIQNDVELTRTSVAIVDLMSATNKRKRNLKSTRK